MVTSIFCFSHNVFKRHLFQGFYKSVLCGKELNKLPLQNFVYTVYLMIESRVSIVRNEYGTYGVQIQHIHHWITNVGPLFANLFQ